MWNTDQDKIPEKGFWQTIPVWIKTVDGRQVIAVRHNGNKYWYPLKDFYDDTSMIHSDKVVGWLPIEPPEKG